MNSLLAPDEVESRWRELHRQFSQLLIGQLRVREGDGTTDRSGGMDERLVQAIWHDQMICAAPVTASGKTLEIIEPGRWNTSRGPDFLDARFRLAGEMVTGDVEIHLDSNDWQRHGHHRDFEYNRVVLHVVLRAHDDRPYEEKQNGERLERLVLDSQLEPDLDTIRSTINLAEYPHGRPAYLGLCHEQFLRLPSEQLAEFLLVAGRSRIEQKVARYRSQLSTAGFHQVVYQTLMTAQGFKSSKTLYFLLSRRLPLSELLDYARDFPPASRAEFLLAALLYVAQLMPENRMKETEDLDAESEQFLEDLRQFQRTIRPYVQDRLLPPTRRWFAGIRPAGFPPRRLAAVTVLLDRLFQKEDPLLPRFRETVRETQIESLSAAERRRFWKRLIADFVVDGNAHYFGTRYTLGGKKQRAQALLGEPAAMSLVFNAFLPLLLVEAREKKDRLLAEKAMTLLLAFPALEKNSIVRFMEKRLFGESKGPNGLLRLEIYQQALMKMFHDCCAANERTCDDCTFLALAEQLGQPAGAADS